MSYRTSVEAVDAAISIAFGGVAARMAKHFDVSDQTVSWWRKGERDGKKVAFPAEHCPEVERLTNRQVQCEELRPDVAWHVLRAPTPATMTAPMPAPPTGADAREFA